MDPERWRRVEELYHLALEVKPDQRDAYLEEVCAADLSLRNEVERLLDRRSEAEAFIESPALELAAKTLAAETESESDSGLVGQALSHYKVLQKIGAGGMGVVYRARDENLGRDVALKILPDLFAGDPERLARFEREAKLLASLNHPNIAAIHGLERTDSGPVLVMELVEGDTLAQRIAKGPLPVEEALAVCRQIAEGLEAAHEKGVLHRDLKPANVKITPDGNVKILDFGLAKAFQVEASVGDMAQSPTISEVMTRTGVILGTAAYMSPEQAKGKTVDKRTDIWAFGCILYECLTGKAPFKGETVMETVAKIIEGTPDWNLLPLRTPWRAKELLHRCLQKNPRERLRDIGDARIEIGVCVSEPSEVIPAAQGFPLRWVSISTATLLIGLLGGLLVMRYFTRPTSVMSQPVIRASVKMGPGYWLDGWRSSGQPTRTAMALSTNGRFVVYSAIKENPTPQDKPCLYLRKLEQLEAKPITGTEGGISPFLSPDDHWIGFWADGKLKKVSVEGGVPTALCEVRLPYGFSWGVDNQIVFAPLWEGGLSRVSADGGKPEALTVPDKSKEEYGHRLPHCLPAGKGILFTIMRYAIDLQPRTAVLEPGTRKWRVLLDDAADARYVVTGHLAFLRQGTLMLAPFDADKLEITGQPFPAIENVIQALNAESSNFETAAGQFSISASGSMTFAAGGILPDREYSLIWVDQKGNAQPIAPFKAHFIGPRLSPDGQRIAYYTGGKERQVWVYDLNRGTATKLTSEGMAMQVTWTPDSRRLVFGWSKASMFNLYGQAVDGSSPMERLTPSEYTQVPGSWSPDGEMLAFVQWGSGLDRSFFGLDILFLRMRDRKITPFLNSRFEEMYPEFSPDGRWISYVSDESGRAEVYVQPFPGPGGKWQISNEGGTEPLWSRNGKQLYYRRPNQVWAVDVQTGSAFSASKPRLLFDQPGYDTNIPIRNWDISPDGQRFLMVKLDERKSQPVTEMILVQNWFEELKRLVPAR